MSDDFPSRWSRRKLEDARAEEDPPQAVAEGLAGEDPPAEESDAEILARLGLKHPDEMEPGDDFAAFARAAVPRHLKTIAWRRLWRSNTTLACLDGLNDYDGDFTGTGVPEGGLRTSYEVGRGILRRIAESAGEQAADAPEEVADADAADGTEKSDSLPDELDRGTPAENMQSAESVQENDTPRPGRRRMVFRTKG
jgi:hypothetical protein